MSQGGVRSGADRGFGRCPILGGSGGRRGRANGRSEHPGSCKQGFTVVSGCSRETQPGGDACSSLGGREMAQGLQGHGGCSARVDRAWRPSLQRHLLRALTSGEKGPAEGEGLAGVLGGGKN